MTTPAPKQKLPLWQKLLIGAGTCFVALVILGLIVGPEKKTDTAAPTDTTTATASTTAAAPTTSATTTAAPATSPAAAPATQTPPPAPTASPDQQIATAAETYVKENWGMAPDASWQGFQCTAGMTCWQPYVVRFEFNSGVLRPTLQIDGGQKALGQKAAKNIASFIGFSKEPWAQQIDWVEVMDGTGVHVAQESVTRR